MKGNIKKMSVVLESPAQYQLPVGDDMFPMNDAIGQQIQLEYLGEIHCVCLGIDAHDV